MLALWVAQDGDTGGEVMVSERDIEKLKALGYSVEGAPWPNSRGDKTPREFQAYLGGNTWRHLVVPSYALSEAACWTACKAHVQSPEGMAATMDAACEWLGTRADLELVRHSKRRWSAWFVDTHDNHQGDGPSPAAAVSALLWKVP